MLLVERSSDTPIRPKDIESDHAFTNTFGKRDAEIAAYWIVRYCQSRRSWLPFMFEQIATFCYVHDQRTAAAYNFLMEGVVHLVIDGLVRLDKQKVTLTTTFIARCYASAPVQGMPRKRGPRKPRKNVRSRYQRIFDDDLL